MRTSNLKYLLLCLFPVACDAQAPPTYQGEPLVSLQGTLSSQSTDPLPEADLLLGWLSSDARPTPFQKVQVSVQLPSRFTAELFQPPPESAYAAHPYSDGYTALGPRTATAEFVLARHGVTVTDPSINWVDPSANQVLGYLDHYFLVYYETDGYPGVRDPDGIEHLGPYTTKGYHLGRTDTTECTTGLDQTCVDTLQMAFGTLTEGQRQSCYSERSFTTSVEVPLNTPIDLVIPGPPPLPYTLAPCPPSQE